LPKGCGNGRLRHRLADQIETFVLVLKHDLRPNFTIRLQTTDLMVEADAMRGYQISQR